MGVKFHGHETDSRLQYFWSYSNFHVNSGFQESRMLVSGTCSCVVMGIGGLEVHFHRSCNRNSSGFSLGERVLTSPKSCVL
jgi:hypothetical protein